jgi:hypothetical protein
LGITPAAQVRARRGRRLLGVTVRSRIDRSGGDVASARKAAAADAIDLAAAIAGQGASFGRGR